MSAVSGGRGISDNIDLGGESHSSIRVTPYLEDSVNQGRGVNFARNSVQAPPQSLEPMPAAAFPEGSNNNNIYGELPLAAPASGFPARLLGIPQAEPPPHLYTNASLPPPQQAQSPSQERELFERQGMSGPMSATLGEFLGQQSPANDDSAQSWDPFGGYSGPHLNRPQGHPSDAYQNDGGEVNADLNAEHRPAFSDSQQATGMGLTANPRYAPIARRASADAQSSEEVPQVAEISPNIHGDIDLGQSGVAYVADGQNFNDIPPSVISMMDRDVARIKFVLEHKRVLVSHLNAMLKVLKMGTHGLKKEKHERLLMLAQRLRINRDAGRLHSVRLAIDNESPPELRPLGNGGDGQQMAQLAMAPLEVNGNVRNAANAISRSHNQPLMRSTAVNPLVAPRAGRGPKPELSFRESPFYRLGKMLKAPIFFLKPHLRRRLTQTVSFQCNAETLQKSGTHVFLMCQVFNPQAGDLRPVYFPFYNELELDEEKVTANTRGVRGIPGSARPVDLTPIILKKGSKSHKLKITVIVSDQGEVMTDKSYAFGLFYGFKTPHEQLVEVLKTRPHIEFEQTKQMAMRAASGDNDDDGFVVSSDAVYSLKDNVMMTRIALPIRSKACEHIDCFDALTFLMLQDQAETWKCPVCNRTITWESLAVDDFFSEILQSAGEDAETVAIKADGTWSLETSGDSTDSDESDSDDDKPQPFAKKGSAEIVDLLSDTEDESPQRIPDMQQPSNEGSTVNGQHAQVPTTPNANMESNNSGDSNVANEQGTPALSPQQPAGVTVSDESNAPENGQVTTLPVFEALRALRSGNQEHAVTTADSPTHHQQNPAGQHYDIPRHEIYATLRAFQKSHNLIFDNPLKLSRNLTPPHEQQQQLTPPVPSPPQLGPENPVQPPVIPQVPETSDRRDSHHHNPNLRLVDDDDDDDIIDLTGDD